jgi:hypothetical protein
MRKQGPGREIAMGCRECISNAALGAMTVSVSRSGSLFAILCFITSLDFEAGI